MEMVKTLVTRIAVFIALSPLLAQVRPSTGVSIILSYPASSMPAIGFENQVLFATGAASTSSCVIGGGSAVVFCRWNGSSWAPAGDGSSSGGSGITSLGGQTGASQTFSNDANVTIVSSSDVHTLTWAGVLSGSRGGTNNAFTQFSGPSGSVKTFTLPNASATVLTDNALVTVGQGGTGVGSLSGILIGNGTSAFTAVTNSSTVGQVLRVTGVSAYGWGALDLSDSDAITGIIPNGNTTATSSNTFSAIVARDVSGNFSAATITASLSGNASSATALATPRTIGNVAFDGTANIVPETSVVVDSTDATSFIAMFDSANGNLQPKTDAGITYNASTGMLTATGFTGPLTGNASTASVLQTSRNINGVSFNGSADITVTAAAGTLTGSTLASGVTASSLTSFGSSPTLTTPTISGAVTFPDDVRQIFNPGANAAGLNVGAQTTDPGTPSNGDIYYDSDDNLLRARINGAWVNLGAGGSGLGDPGSNGFVDRTALNTTSARTLTGTANEISVANGGGGGNPVFSLASALNLSSKTVQIPGSTTLPGSCTGTEIYLDTDAASGQRFYACESGVFVLQGDGGGGGGLTQPQVMARAGR